MKEASARIKINKLLEAAGWRFFENEDGPANIRLESTATLTQADLDAFGEDFEKTKKGFIDYLLLNEKGFPLVVLEAKAESKNPLTGKEQARKYAQAQKCRFVILSNGNRHYFWDLERGNPETIRPPAPARLPPPPSSNSSLAPATPAACCSSSIGSNGRSKRKKPSPHACRRTSTTVAYDNCGQLTRPV